MIAEKENRNYTTRYKKTVRTSVETVWGILADNEKLNQWFEDTKTLHYKRSVLYLI